MLFVVNRSAIRHQNKSYELEDNNKYRQKPKIHGKSAIRKCRSHLIQNNFSENFIHDSSKVAFDAMGTINVGKMR